MKSDILNLLFDLGNVIVDIDIPGAHQRLNQLLRPDAQQDLIQKVLQDYECGRISTDLFINGLISQSHRDVQALDIIEVWNSILIGAPKHRLKMLEDMKTRYPVYLLSNTNAMHVEWLHRYFLRQHQVDSFEDRYFTGVYYSHVVGDRKPNASIFQFLIEDTGLDPRRTLFLDDLQENLDTARTLGFHTHLVEPSLDVADYLRNEGY